MFFSVNRVPPHLRKGPGPARVMPGGDEISRHMRVSSNYYETIYHHNISHVLPVIVDSFLENNYRIDRKDSPTLSPPPPDSHLKVGGAAIFPGADCHQSSTIPPWPIMAMCVTIQSPSEVDSTIFEKGWP